MQAEAKARISKTESAFEARYIHPSFTSVPCHLSLPLFPPSASTPLFASKAATVSCYSRVLLIAISRSFQISHIKYTCGPISSDFTSISPDVLLVIVKPSEAKHNVYVTLFKLT